MTPADQFFALCIVGYQKHLSPRKGFRCAHRVLHGEKSCSEFVKTAILEKGWRAALSSSRQRFAECKMAAQILRAEAQDSPFETTTDTQPTPKARKRQSCSDRCGDPCQGCDCGYCGDLFDALPRCAHAAHGLDCSHCAHGLDFGHCDCGGCDCGPCS